MANPIIVGTELKFSMRFMPIDNYTANDYDFSIDAYCRPNTRLTIPKSECIQENDHTFLVMVDTAAIGAGTLSFEVTAYIPDADFPDKLRTEVVRFTTNVEIIN